MKRLYTSLGVLCSALLLPFGSLNAQENIKQENFTTIPAIAEDIPGDAELNAKQRKLTQSKGGDAIVYFSEDFSNGFDGQGENGAWTVGGPQGDLWFHTFPAGAENGYNRWGPLTGPAAEVYGDSIPNFFNVANIINSPTASNGFMFMDADRWNSFATNADSASVGVAFLQSNTISTQLISPVMDLSAAEGEPLYITFAQQWRMCCTGYVLNIDVSVDGGATWLPFDYWQLSGAAGNVVMSGTGIVDISSVTLNATDLSQFQFRVFWNGAQTHYYFQIDDVAIIRAPDNELAIGRTFLNNYFDYPGDDEDTEYVKRFGYWNQPQYITRPFNFAAVVTNNGFATQTGVRLQVTFNPQVGDPQTFFSDPIELESGASDTLRILDVIPDDWAAPAEAGTYISDFEIIQDQDDEFPDNNVGVSRSTRISLDSEGVGAIFQNDRNAISNLPNPPQASNSIHGNRFVFTEPLTDNAVITHVEFVLLNNGTTSVTVPGEVIFINVRSGSVYEPEGPDNEIVRYFGSEDIEYTIEAEDISIGGVVNWISVELPNPILVQPDLIYQGEVEIPAGEQPIAFVGLSNDNESGASVVITFEGADPTWGSYTDIATMIRFRTQNTVSVSDVSYESGIKLTQNYPNPFVDQTRIQYQLDKSSNVRLSVFDISGKLVFSDNLGQAAADQVYSYEFQRRNLASGIYSYTISTDTEQLSRKMVVE